MILLTDPRTGDTTEVRTLLDEPPRYIEGVGKCRYFVWVVHHRADHTPCAVGPYLFGPTDAFGLSRILETEGGQLCDNVILRDWKREILPD